MTLLIIASIWGLGITGVIIVIAVSVVRSIFTAQPASNQLSLGSFLLCNIGGILACMFGLAASAIFYYGLVVYPFLLAVRYYAG